MSLTPLSLLRHGGWAVIGPSGVRGHGWGPLYTSILLGDVVLPPLYLYEPARHRALRDVQPAEGLNPIPALAPCHVSLTPLPTRFPYPPTTSHWDWILQTAA